MFGSLSEVSAMFATLEQMEQAMITNVSATTHGTAEHANAHAWRTKFRSALNTLNKVFNTPTSTPADCEVMINCLDGMVQKILDAIETNHAQLARAAAGGELKFVRANIERILASNVVTALTTQHDGTSDRNHAALVRNLKCILDYVSNLEDFLWLIGQRNSAERVMMASITDLRRRMSSTAVMPASTLISILRRMAYDFR